MGPGRLSQSLLLRCRRAAAARCRGGPLFARPFSAAVRLRAPQQPPGRGEPPRAGGGARWKGAVGAGGDGEEEEEDEDEEDAEEAAELEELLGPSPLAVGPGAQRVAVVHPAVKWGPKKSPLTTGGWVGGRPQRCSAGAGGSAAGGCGPGIPPRVAPARRAASRLPAARSLLLQAPAVGRGTFRAWVPVS